MSVLVCSTLAWLLLGTPSSGINDADMFLVYTRNFLSGNGFVYNVGSEQLDGFPSLLWMLVSSLVYVMSSAVEVPLFLLNLLFGICTVYICLMRCNQKPAFLLLLCSAPAWFAWCQIALVETGLWCLLLTASILAVSERNISKCTWLLPALALTRPESMLWGFWLILVLLLGLGLDAGWRVGLRATFRPLFSFGIVWTALILFWKLNFGDLPPSISTTSQEHGLQVTIWAGIFYLLGYLLSNPAVLLVGLVFGWVCVREVRRKRGLSRALAVCICLLPGLGIPLMAGDERSPSFGFYQPIWPLLCLVAAWAIPLLYERQPAMVRRLAPVALLLAGWMTFTLSPNLKPEFRTARKSREQGSVLANMFEGHSLPSVGIMAANGCRYTYPGMVYDLKELDVTTWDQNDNQHLFNREVFDDRFPDIIIQSETESVEQRVINDLQSDPQFQQRYIKGELWYNDGILFAYFSRSFLNGLEDGHYAFSEDLQHALSMGNTMGLSDAISDEPPLSGFAARDKNSLTQDVPPLWSPPSQL